VRAKSACVWSVPRACEVGVRVESACSNGVDRESMRRSQISADLEGSNGAVAGESHADECIHFLRPAHATCDTTELALRALAAKPCWSKACDHFCVWDIYMLYALEGTSRR
jgi:hypothetical protein